MSEQLSFPGFAPPPPRVMTDRLFFAAFPDPLTAERIAQLAGRQRDLLGLRARAFAPDRFHITLNHLGDYPSLPGDIVAAATQAGAAIAFAPFEVAFDRVESFFKRSGSRPFVLRGGEGLDGVVAFQRALGAAMVKAGLGKHVERSFTPHVTLLYDDQMIAALPVEAIGWTVREFVLVHSLLGQTRHVALARWTLGG
jgi:2'-5' RNA ligase